VIQILTARLFLERGPETLFVAPRHDGTRRVHHADTAMARIKNGI
jgi:hypothetical protein